MKLLPPEHSLKPLQDDYTQMRAMIYGDDISFDAILDSLRELETEKKHLNKTCPEFVCKVTD